MVAAALKSRPFVALLLASAACPALAASAPAAEAAADDTTIAEITVTAQRRVERLQEVPLAVSALSNLALERAQVSSTTGLVQLIPNLSGGEVSGAGSANNYSLRGLYNAETASTFDSPVGTYIDGIFLGRLSASNFALFDVERMEVLRGPQGTLFGRNTTGGAINIILKKPAAEFGGYVEGEYGSFDFRQLRGAIDIPLSEHVRTRLAGYYMREDGWVRNVTTGGRENGHDGQGVRGAVSVDFTPDISWNVAADYSWDDNPNIPATRNGGKFTSKSGLGKLSALFPDEKGKIPGNAIINESWGVTSNLTINASIGTVEIITGYRDLVSNWNVDYFDGPGPNGGFTSVEYSTHRQFTQEVKFNGDLLPGLGYTAGVFYFHEDNFTNFSTVFTLAGGVPFIDADRIYRNKTDSMAGYAQFDYKVTPKLTLTVGGRYTLDDKNIRYQDNANPRALAKISNQILIAGNIPLDQSKGLLTPRFALRYEPSRDLMFYGSATRGFKSGGWNVRGTNALTLGAFGPEKIWSYEAGMRSSLFDRRLQINLTGFYGKVDDLQIATASIGPTGAPQFPVGNFAGLKSYGFELESTFVPVSGLTFGFNAGYNKTKYADPAAAVLVQQNLCLASIAAMAASRPNCGAGIITPAGQIADTARSPEWTLTGSASYEVPVTGDWRLVPSVSIRYVSSFNTNAAQLPIADDNGYVMVSGGLTFDNPVRNMAVSIGCENCNDAHYLLTTIGGRFWYNAPRRITGRVRLGF